MRDIALTLLILGLLPVCFARPWLGILVWYWFGLMNPHMFTWSFARGGIPFAMLIGGATLAGTLIARDKRPVPWNRELILVAVLFACFTLTSFFAWAPQAAWAYWNQVWKILLMTFLATMFIYGKDRIRALMLVIGLSLAFYGIKGAIFTIRTGGAHKVMGPEGVFIGENTFLGLALVMVIPVLISSAREERGKVFKNFLYFAAGCCVVSAVFTYSRGALVGLAIILPLLLLKNPRKAWASIVFLLVAGSIVYTVAPEQLWKRAQTIETYETDLSAMQRLRAWSVALNIAKDRPFIGAGFQFEYAANRERWLSYVDDRYRHIPGGRSAAHSAYFQVMGQHGFVAFGVYVLLLACTFATLARIRKHARESSEAAWLATYADGLLIGTVAFAVSGAFLNVAYFDLYFIYVAMTAMLGREQRGIQTSMAATGPRATPVAPQAATSPGSEL